MKNKTLKIALLMAFVAGFFISCDEEDVNTFTGPTTSYFTPTSYAINAEDSANTTTEIEIVSTSTSSTDREYTIEIDPASTAVLGTDFTLASNTITIPAGSYSGTLEVTSILTENTYFGATALINLIGNEVSQYSNVANVAINHTTCVVDSALYTGNYTLEQVAGDNGFGNAFTATTVTLTNTGGVGRSFDSVYLNDFGQGEMTFTFNLDCGMAIPDNEQNTGLSCGATILLNTIDTNEGYNPFNDDELFISFAEEIDPACPAAQSTTTTIKLTKI